MLAATAGAAVVSGFLGFGWLSAAAGAAFFFVLWFFRDPEREVPQDDRAVVSPADGRVVEIARVHEDELLKADAVRVGIFMSPLNVHVNRIPYGGRVLTIKHHPGKFLSAFRPEASIENERNAVLLEAVAGQRLLFVQIAGLLARRIVHWIGEGDRVRRGQRYGLIKFGSRLDLYLPPETRLRVAVGQKVKAGASVIGTLS